MGKTRNIGSQIKTLHDLGFNYVDIKKKLNCSYGTIAYHLEENARLNTIRRSEERKNIKRRYVQSVKEAAVCIDCKIDYPYWILEFDHVRGRKLAAIAAMLNNNNYSLDDVKAEIEKCEIVCGNCHKDRTFKRLKGSKLARG